MPNRYGGVGITLPLNQLGTNNFTLQAGEVIYIPPGYFNIAHGPYSTIQVYDPVMTVWRPIANDGFEGNFIQIDSDGNNYRIANQTGCPVAAVLSNAGTGYTSAPTITAAAGSSSWQAIMGQVVSTTVTVVAGGTNYVYPPLMLISAPPSPGIPATGYTTLTSGSISSATILNQGAGYMSAPTVSVVNDPRDTTGSGGILTCALTGSQTVNAVICTNHGLPITSQTVPALTFSGGGGSSAAATIIMDWTVTSYAVTNGGTGYLAGAQVTTSGFGAPTIAPAYTNPNSQASFFRGRSPVIQAAVSGSVLVAAGQLVVDGGHIASQTSGSNNIYAQTTGGFGTTAPTVATLTLGVGGVSDFLWMQAG
jgi:hypothetical protein